MTAFAPRRAAPGALIVWLLAAVLLAAASPTAADAASPSPKRAWGKLCADQRAGVGGATSFRQCVSAMRRLAKGRTDSPRAACRGLGRQRVTGSRKTPFKTCVEAGRRLRRVGTGLDLSFVREVIPHHESAVAMAELGLARGESQFVRDLSHSIIASQNAEIATMRSIASRLAAYGIRPRSMGLSPSEMGMDHDASHLQTADPFDPAFVEMMIPHHEGALRMSQVVLDGGTGTRTRRLARQIVESQSREIEAMRRWQAENPSPPHEHPDEDHHDGVNDNPDHH